MNKLNKTLTLFLMAVFLLTMLAGCTQNKDSDNEIKNVVTIKDVEKRIESKETFAFVIGSKDCSACDVYDESLKELKEKEDVILDYILFEDGKEEDMINLITGMGENINNGLGTPTTFFIVDGESTGHPVVGAVDKKDIVEVYKEGFNKEAREEGVIQKTAKDVISKIDDKESFIFVIGSDNCPACLQHKINLSTLFEERNVKLDYIDIDKESDDELSKLVIDTIKLDLSEGLSTPTTVIIINGEVYKKPIVGALSETDLIEMYDIFQEETKK